MSFEIIESVEPKEKRMKKNSEESLKDLWDTVVSIRLTLSTFYINRISFQYRIKKFVLIKPYME